MFMYTILFHVVVVETWDHIFRYKAKEGED